MTMIGPRGSFPLLLLAALATGCGSTPTDPQMPADAAASTSAGSEVAVAPSFDTTEWFATELSGTAITATGASAPHLVFDGERVSGANGCNRVTGGYTRNGEALTFGMLATTRMFCPDSAAIEKAFSDVTERTRGWRMAGATLELLDEAGTVVGRFEAR